MPRNFIKISIVLALVLFFTSGCLKLIKNRNRDDIVAQVGNVTLRRADIANLYSGEDSLKLTHTYMNNWIMRQLKVLEAEKYMDAYGIDIEDMVKDYRNSLLSQKLDQHYIEMSVDTTINNQQIAEYYNNHKSEFVLALPLVKGKIVRVPKSFRQSAKLKELMSSDSSEKQKDFEDICLKNGFRLVRFDTWSKFGDFLNNLPIVQGGDYRHFMDLRSVQTISDNSYDYFFRLSEVLQAGSTTPMEMLDNEIRRIILNQRINDIVKSHEDTLYRTALNEGLLVINN